MSHFFSTIILCLFLKLFSHFSSSFFFQLSFIPNYPPLIRTIFFSTAFFISCSFLSMQFYLIWGLKNISTENKMWWITKCKKNETTISVKQNKSIENWIFFLPRILTIYARIVKHFLPKFVSCRFPTWNNHSGEIVVTGCSYVIEHSCKNYGWWIKVEGIRLLYSCASLSRREICYSIWRKE